jgi:hypothetical protein
VGDVASLPADLVEDLLHEALHGDGVVERHDRALGQPLRQALADVDDLVVTTPA